MKNLIIIIVLVVSLIVAGSYIFMKPKANDLKATAKIEDVSVNKTPPLEVGNQATGPVDANVSAVQFVVNGGNYYFAPSTITVKEGDTVTINFKNNEGFHDFVIDEFKVATKQIKDIGEESVSFVANKKGSFEYYCSVGSHRAMGMKGTLIVQ